MSTQTERLSTALAGQYRIERHLGEGGMAVVYLAQDLKHDRRVAVKVLRPELAAVIGAERFIQEIKTTAALQHPNILPLFDSGRTGSADGQYGTDFLFYVMPFVEGETLRDKLKRETQLDIDEAVRIASEVGDALDYAHRHGIIHRDIKPENILIHDGRPLVADFGIALALSAAAGGRMTETGLSLGTPFYMSPEQATAEKELTARSDVYSLGCVLYEMLTGEPPHTGASAQAIVMKIMTDVPRPVTDLRKSVPAHVAAAAAKALEKLPADRFSTARAFTEALRNPAFTTASAHNTQVSAPASARARTSRLTVALALATVMLASTTAWGWLRSGSNEERPTTRARLVTDLESGLGNDFGSQVAISPDGSRIVFASGVDGVPKLWLLERNQLQPKIIPGTEQAHQPFFSPDGTKIGFMTWDRRLRIVSLNGEPPTTLLDSAVVRGGGTWGADGYIYVSGGSRETGIDNTGLMRIAAAGGGKIEQVSHIDSSHHEVVHNQPDWLPGGHGVLFTVQHDRQYDAKLSEIAVLDLETGKHHTLLQGVIARYSPSGHVLVVRADGALIAAPFDTKTLQLTGPATPLLDGVEMEGLASADISISNTGVLIYQPSGGTSAQFEPVWVRRDGVVQPIDTGWTTRLRHPALSPDGKQLALVVVDAESQVWIKQLDQGPFSKLSFEGKNNVRPAWSGDGKSLFYSSDAKNTRAAIAVKRADGSSEAKIVLAMQGNLQEVVTSRDGEWAVVRTNAAPSGDLYAFRPNKDTVAIPVATTKFDEQQASFSPDGKWLAYTSNESGQYQVYVRPFPNVASAKWQVSVNGGIAPRWAHSGHEIFYRDGQTRMVAAQVLTTPQFSIGDQKVLFSLTGYFGLGDNAQSYDVAPDDKRFVMIRQRSTSGNDIPPLVIVDNFFAEIRQKVGGR